MPIILFYILYLHYRLIKYIKKMKKSITFYKKDKDSEDCVCIIQNLVNGKDKAIFNVPIHLVGHIVYSNLED